MVDDRDGSRQPDGGDAPESGGDAPDAPTDGSDDPANRDSDPANRDSDPADRGEGARHDDGPARRLWEWVLLDADRRTVTAILTVGFFVAMVVLGAADPSPLRATMTRTDPVDTLFQSLVAAVITGVTLTLTINQIVLSEELGAVGDQRERMTEAIEFRREVEDVIDAPASPSAPAAFMQALADAIEERARTLGETVGTSGDATGEAGTGADLVEDVEGLAGDLAVRARAVGDALEGAEFGTFDVLSAILALDYSWNLHEVRRIRATHGEPVGEETGDALDDVALALELFGTAREHFKTLYFRWELANLSRSMLYVAVPALVATTATVLYFDAGVVPGASLGVSNVVWVVSAAATVAVLPFVTLLSYILRIATVAKRTLAIGPFVLTGGGD